MISSICRRFLLAALLLVTTSCSWPDPDYARAKQRFTQDRATYEELLKAVMSCDFRSNGHINDEVDNTIHSNPAKNQGSCGGDAVRTGAISALLRKAGAHSVVWWSGSQGTNVDIFYSDQYAPGTKTRTTLAIAYVIPAMRKTSDDDSANAPACWIKARALTNETPYNWAWVYRRYIIDDGNRKWCEDLRLP